MGEYVMAKQKQGGGKARKGVSGRAANTDGSDRASQKKKPTYLRGPKDGGPTLADRVASHDAAQRRLAEERKNLSFAQRHSSRW